MVRSGVYKFTNLMNGRVYIGSSIDIDKRYNDHVSGPRYSIPLRNAVRKYGVENFSFEILKYVDNNIDKQQLIKTIEKCEQDFLNQYYAQEYILSNGEDDRFRKLTYNINPTSRGARGNKWSEKSRQNLKNKIKSNGFHLSNRILSDHSIQKMKNTFRERGVSVGKNNPNYGRKSTPEKRDKMIAAWLKSGVVKPFHAYKDGIQYGPYNTSTDCHNDLFVDRAMVKHCLNGKYKQSKGYTFKHITNES